MTQTKPESTEQFESSSLPPSQPIEGDGQRPASEVRTVDAPASGGRTGTLSFSVDPIEDTDLTLPPEAEPQLAPGPRVAGFEIIGVLGEGGMGIVFKARQMRGAVRRAENDSRG